MKADRYQILSLANTGQIPQEEAELRLADLGRRERRVLKLILAAVLLIVLAVLIIVFHLEDKIRMVVFSAWQNVEGSALYRGIYSLVRRVEEAL